MRRWYDPKQNRGKTMENLPICTNNVVLEIIGWLFIMVGTCTCLHYGTRIFTEIKHMLEWKRWVQENKDLLE